MLATLNLLDEEGSGGSDAKDQTNASDWQLSVSEEELSSEDETENAPDLSATSNAFSHPVMSNSH